MSTRDFAIDFGYMFLKGFPGGDIQDVFRIQNAVGGLNTHYTGTNTPYRFDGASHVDGSFSVDEYAVQFGGATHNRQDREWFEVDAFMKLFYAGCARGGIKNKDVVRLGICIPIDDRQKADKIRARLLGEHTYTLYGEKPVKFSVESVFITLQGIAAYGHFCYGMSGERKKIEFRGEKVYADTLKVYISECGGNTWQEVMMLGGVDTREGTRTLYHQGGWNIVEAVQEHIEQEYGVQRSKLALVDAVHKGEVWIKGPVDLKPFIEAEKRRLFKTPSDQITAHDLTELQVLLVAGGTGAEMLDLHKAIDDRFQLLPNPAFANVVGTYKMMLAQKKGGK